MAIWLQVRAPCTGIPGYLANLSCSGITVGAVVVPQSMAYAALAELEPQFGLYSSFMGVLIYWFFATSKDITIGVSSLEYRSPKVAAVNICEASSCHVDRDRERRQRGCKVDPRCSSSCSSLGTCHHRRRDHLFHRTHQMWLDRRLHFSSCYFRLHDRISSEHCCWSSSEPHGNHWLFEPRIDVQGCYQHSEASRSEQARCRDGFDCVDHAVPDTLRMQLRCAANAESSQDVFLHRNFADCLCHLAVYFDQLSGEQTPSQQARFQDPWQSASR